RDRTVTGVQTCALPIYTGLPAQAASIPSKAIRPRGRPSCSRLILRKAARVAVAGVAAEVDAEASAPSDAAADCLTARCPSRQRRSEERRVGKGGGGGGW